jgi:putative MATE family efflux protein
VGAGDSRQAALFACHGIGIGAGLGLIVGLLALLAPSQALVALTADPAVAVPAADYLRVTLCGMLWNAPLLAILFSLHGAGKGQAALKVGAVFPLLNTVLDPLLIWGFGLGLPGAAWATLLANAVAVVIGLRVLLRHLPLGDGFEFRPQVVRQIVAIGAPGSLEHMLRNMAGFALVAFLFPFGAAVLSGYTAGLAVLMILICPGLALGQATASLVGQSLGANRPDQAWRTAGSAALLYATFMAFAGALVFVFAEPAIAAFDINPLAISAGATFLRTLAPALPLLGVGLILGKAFSGARRPKTALAASALSHLGVQLPLVALLTALSGPTGAYLGMALAYAIHGIVSAIFFARLFRTDLLQPEHQEVTQ